MVFVNNKLFFAFFFLFLQKYQAYFGPILGSEGFTIECQLSRPKSRGEVTLRSDDPNDYPIVNPNFLSHPEDVNTIVKG